MTFHLVDDQVPVADAMAGRLPGIDAAAILA
jgi:hypothetical protein